MHKASLVNLRHVKEIVPWFGGRYKLVMRDHAGSEVAVSRTPGARPAGQAALVVCGSTTVCLTA